MKYILDAYLENIRNLCYEFQIYFFIFFLKSTFQLIVEWFCKMNNIKRHLFNLVMKLIIFFYK